MSEDKKHALLSASSSHKWLVCPPSARLEEQFENKTSEYMEEGTLAHEIAEFKVKSYQVPISKRKYNSELKKFEKRELYNSEMLTHTDTYLEYIKGLALQTHSIPFMAVEQTIDFSAYVPEGFGTADFLMISGDTLTVVDFKYGKGVSVSAENNPQMKLYALGAFETFRYIYTINKVKMAIVQPRLDNISEFEITTEELLKWGNEVVKIQAEKAFKGEGEFAQGEHCRFCRAKGRCEFRTNENLKKYEEAKSTAIISNVELGQVLSKVEGLDSWIKDLKEEALKQILQGNDVEGWKAVEGRSNRKITDLDNAFEILKANGFEETMLYERKPLTLTELEKVVGKKKLTQLIGDHIEKPKGAPTLAKASDKREKYKESSALEDFRKRGKLMSKFKIGDKVRIKKDLGTNRDYEIGIVTDMTKYKGEVTIITELTIAGNYKLAVDKGTWTWSDDMLEKGDFGKTDLKPGYLIKLRNNDLCMVMPTQSHGKILVKLDCKREVIYWCELSVFTEELLKRNDSSLDIIEVYGYSIYASDVVETNLSSRNLIWKREEDKKEMTIAQIEKELGYSVKIIKEEN